MISSFFGYKNIAIGALSLSLLSFFYYHSSVVKDYEIKIKDNEILFAKAIAKEHERKIEVIINAINEQNKVNEQIKLDAANASSANDRLRETIDSLNSQVSTLTENARIDYENTLSDLLKDCTASYSEMARKADEHASDARTFFNIYKGNEASEFKESKGFKFK